ncbi:TPA: hypothetical protein DCZ15_02850 [Candidatus Falkowbacteria bacterium]|nr:MAG: hypothetical protein UV95_C0001G0228 [Candidatus Falkowbacteria bacterium GW2011_GWF2_43_32]HBA36795.1 hypothetical protein [Candidatus Falkowbacteria bacterium]
MTANNLPNLNDSVREALDFFRRNRPPHWQSRSGLRFVVGSVNAYHTGKMLFSDQAAIFADESDFSTVLKTYRPLIKNKTIKEAVVISASGEKDSVWEVKAAQAAGLKTRLLTCNADSSAAKLADDCVVFNKIPEPYSYNFSTYLGMLLSVTGESATTIKKFLSAVKPPLAFKKSSFFSFVLPDRFRPIADMIMVKDDELFGPYSSLRAYSEGQARHAKFIARSSRELIISFDTTVYFGDAKQRWNIKLPKNADFGLILALSYHLVGLIQKQKPPYFKKGLARFCRLAPLAYGKKEPWAMIVK